VGLAGHDPVDGGVVGSQFIGSRLRTFLDRNPERVVLQPKNRDAQRLFRHDVNRSDRTFVRCLTHGIKGRSRRTFHIGNGDGLGIRCSGGASAAGSSAAPPPQATRPNARTKQQQEQCNFFHLASPSVKNGLCW
jgi:hypothetical protein